MFEDLKGKSILIVGCSKGIGKNLVSALQYFSPSLHLISRNNPNISEFENLTTSFYPLDITQEDDYDTKLKELPKLDGVCFIAGSIRLTPPAMMNKKLITKSFDTNVIGPMALTSYLLKKKLINDNASIIYTSSVGRHSQAECSAIYSASKMSLLGTVNALASDLSKRKVRVNSVSFDYVITEMVKDIDYSQFENDIVGASPVEYTSLPYLYLLSKMSRWVTGQIIAADAGRMLSKTRYV